MSDLLRIGTRSILAYQSALGVVAQNMANQQTPFYSRREVNFTEAIYGNGVNLSDVRRVFDQSASKNFQKSTSELASSDLYVNALKNLEVVFGDSIGTDPNLPGGNGIGKYINEAIKTLNQLNTDVSSMQSRNLYLTQLNNLSTRFKQISGQIQLQSSSINSDLQVDTSRINELTKRIADINTQIKTGSTTDQAALLDRRESLLHDLSGLMDFNVATMDDGEVNITLKNGSPIVSGMERFDLAVTLDVANPKNKVICIKVGANEIIVNQSITGGEIGGLLKFRADLEQTDRSLNRLSIGLSDILNKQNNLGIDVNGKLGKNVFLDVNDISLLAERVTPNKLNNGSGNINVTITDSTKLSVSDYQLKFDASNHYIMSRISDGSVISTGSITAYPASISGEGFDISISSGAFVTGDMFVISPTKNAASSMNVIMKDAGSLALGLPVAISPNSKNTGTGICNVTAITDTSNASFATPLQLNPPMTIEFLSNNTYQLRNANDNSIIEGPLTYDPINGTPVFPTPGGYDPGYRITISGNVMVGDSFGIDFNKNSSGDNRNGLLLANIFNQGLLDNGKYTFTQAYNSVSSDLAIKTNSAGLSLQSAQIINTQANLQYESISGVSIEEESMNLAQYQQAYQASAQILETAKNIFDIIFSLSRG